MSKTAGKQNPSLTIFFVLFLLVLSLPHLYAQALQKSGGHSLTALAATKSNTSFQNDLKKLLSLIRQDKWDEAGPFAYGLAKRSSMVADAADANGLYALVLLRGGYPQEATEEAKQALGLDARSYWALVASGRIELWNGRATQAQEFFRRALQVRPQGAEGRLGLYLAARPGTPEQVRAMLAYVDLAPTGHPHDQIVAGLKSFLKGYSYHRSASAKSPKVDFLPDAHLIQDRGTPKSPVIIPLKCEANGLFVTALINGHAMKLGLDTGSEVIALNPQAARRLSTVSLGRSTTSGVQGEEQSVDYVAKTLQLGPLRWSSISLRTASIEGCDGIINVDFLRHYVVCLDLAHRVMRLTANAETPLAGNSRQRLQFRAYQTKMMFPAQVGKQDVWAILDTGAARTLVSRRISEILAGSLPAGPVRRGVIADQFTIGKTNTKFSYLVLDHPYDITLGQKPLQISSPVPDLVGASSLDDQLSPRLDFEVGMLVGVSSLLAFQQVTIDYKHQALFFDRRIADSLEKPAPVAAPP